MSRKSTEPPSTGEMWVNVECVCGKKGGAHLRHYDVVRCECGKAYWALQPDRGGPLVARPWPGIHPKPERAAT